MNIQINTDVPDYTYFTSADVAPALAGDIIVPLLTASVFVPEANMHRHQVVVVDHDGAGHARRAPTAAPAALAVVDRERVAGERRMWAQLSDEQRRRVLDGKAPGWARSPGKLRSEYKAPAHNRVRAYKLVRRAGERMVSLYDGATEYRIGKRMAQKAADDHAGGYYAYSDINALWRAWNERTLVPERCLEGVDAGDIVLLEVEIAGTIIEYGAKLAATYLTPVRVIEAANV